VPGRGGGAKIREQMALSLLTSSFKEEDNSLDAALRETIVSAGGSGCWEGGGQVRVRRKGRYYIEGGSTPVSLGGWKKGGLSRICG